MNRKLIIKTFLHFLKKHNALTYYLKYSTEEKYFKASYIFRDCYETVNEFLQKIDSSKFINNAFIWGRTIDDGCKINWPKLDELWQKINHDE